MEHLKFWALWLFFQDFDEVLNSPDLIVGKAGERPWHGRNLCGPLASR